MSALERREFLRLTVASLAVLGNDASRVEKILGRNFIRYARDVWG